MLSRIFLGLSLVGAEWVLYLLVLLSILSVALMVERVRFYRDASNGLAEFRARVRQAGEAGKWDEVQQLAQTRAGRAGTAKDMEAEMTLRLLAKKGASPSVLAEVAQDPVVRARLHWDRNLSHLATIGNNAPFVGLFGTVLGIIKAFHDLSQQAGGAAQTVTAGISEALVATAVGLLVAIPAVIAFNFFSRRVRAALAEAEALKSFLVARLTTG